MNRLTLVAVLVLAAIAFLACRWFYPSLKRLITEDLESGLPPRNRDLIREFSSHWFVAGLLFLAASFAWLEWSQPYYFVQDDALVCEMPGMLEGCRAAWSGHAPEYDPYRYMGAPLAPAGFFSLTYPPTYLSYAIARDLLGNEFAMLDVFAAIHLLAGYVILYCLCRSLGMRTMIAVYVALAFLTSGSILIIGRSWHTFITIAVWGPLLMWCVLLIERRRVGWRWVLGTGLASGALFHVGFPQLWLYTMVAIGVGLIVLLITGRIPGRRALLLIPAGLVAIGTMFPLAAAQWAMSRTMHRPPSTYEGITFQWLAAIFPYPITCFAHPTGWGSVGTQYMGQMLYFGTLLALLFVAGWLMLLTTGVRHIRETFGANAWLIAGGVTLLYCMGKPGGLTLLMSKSSLTDALNNHPFRATPLVVLFACVSGGVIGERALRAASLTARWPTVVIAAGIVLLGYGVWIARPAFYLYSFKPYPPLPAELADRLENTTAGRMLSWSPVRAMSEEWAISLPLNLPMAYRALSFTGYDPVMEFNNAYEHAIDRLAADPLAAMRAYGIRWHLFSILLLKPVFSPNPDPTVRQLETTVRYLNVIHALHGHLRTVTTSAVKLGELRDAAPMAFRTADPQRPLPITVSTSSIDVDLTHLKKKTKGDVVLNFLWYPSLEVAIDKRRTKTHADEWGRIVINVPATAQTLHMRYAGKWLPNTAIGFGIVVLGCVAGLMIERRVLGIAS